MLLASSCLTQAVLVESFRWEKSCENISTRNLSLKYFVKWFSIPCYCQRYQRSWWLYLRELLSMGAFRRPRTQYEYLHFIIFESKWPRFLLYMTSTKTPIPVVNMGMDSWTTPWNFFLLLASSHPSTIF